uniref:Uncharacterized protein n=1 Tax=Anopheles coluzzii TaxID=1518534 RepID=A0A8W7PP68_ANOCL
MYGKPCTPECGRRFLGRFAHCSRLSVQIFRGGHQLVRCQIRIGERQLAKRCFLLVPGEVPCSRFEDAVVEATVLEFLERFERAVAATSWACFLAILFEWYFFTSVDVMCPGKGCGFSSIPPLAFDRSSNPASAGIITSSSLTLPAVTSVLLEPLDLTSNTK